MDPIYLLILAAFLVGSGKGGLSSAGSIAVPLVALVMNPVEAAAILLPVFLVTDWVSLGLYRRHFSRRNLAIMVPSAVAGIALATLILPYTSENLLLILTGAIGLWYVLKSWFMPRRSEASNAGVAPGIFWGLLTGVTSFIPHSGAPPAQAYLLPQRLPKLVYAGTLAITFATVNLSKLPGYAIAGQFTGLNWAMIAGLAAIGIVGTGFGRWLTGVLPQEIYTRSIEGLLFTLSIILLFKGGTGLLG